MKRTKLQAAVRKRRIQQAVLKGQNPVVEARLQKVTLKGADLHP